MLINWFSHFFSAAATLIDGITMISEFDFCFVLLFLVAFFYAFLYARRRVSEWADKLGIDLLTFSGPRWWDLSQRTNAVGPVSCPACRDNTPNDLVYPMPISSEPGGWKLFPWRDDPSGRMKGRRRWNRYKTEKIPIHIKLIIHHLILWIILLW